MREYFLATLHVVVERTQSHWVGSDERDAATQHSATDHIVCERKPLASDME